MNIYRTTFTATCPKNDRHVDYTLTIRFHRMVMVEDILAACGKLKRGYHEAFADSLFRQFGGAQTLTAHHHGVDVESVRP